MGCEFTWHHLSAIHPGAVGHFLSTRPTTTNTPPRSVTTALRCGWVRYIGRATILKREANNNNYHHHHQLCSLTMWLSAGYRSGSDPEMIIGSGFQEDAQQLVSRSEPADKIRVFPDFVGLLSDSPDLVF